MRLPSYDVLNASGSFAFTDKLQMFAYVDNITNSMGLTEGNPRQGEIQEKKKNADAGANTSSRGRFSVAHCIAWR